MNKKNFKILTAKINIDKSNSIQDSENLENEKKFILNSINNLKDTISYNNYSGNPENNQIENNIYKKTDSGSEKTFNQLKIQPNNIFSSNKINLFKKISDSQNKYINNSRINIKPDFPNSLENTQKKTVFFNQNSNQKLNKKHSFFEESKSNFNNVSKIIKMKSLSSKYNSHNNINNSSNLKYSMSNKNNNINENNNILPNKDENIDNNLTKYYNKINNIGNLSPFGGSSCQDMKKQNIKCHTTDNFFPQKNNVQTPNLQVKNSIIMKDSLADLGPYIRTPLASPPVGLRKCKIGSGIDIKTPKGTESLKNFYLKYKKENQHFQEVYFEKFLKTDAKTGEKDLEYFDKKYNSKTIFKVRKNYDYFIENNIKYDEEVSKLKNSNSITKKARDGFNLKSFQYNTINGNTTGENNTNNFINKFDLKKFKQIINHSTKSSKLTDKKRLDMLYKYDDFFKLRLESIRSKKKIDNLYDYQNEIVNILNFF